MFKGDLKAKGILREENNYFIIRQALPYPIGENNAYLIECKDGWNVIDMGVNNERTRMIWELSLKEVGISFKQIKNIYITHCHPDHLGAAAWLQDKSNAPVYMSRKEIMRGKQFVFLKDFSESYPKAVEKEFKVAQFPCYLWDKLVRDYDSEVKPLYPEPEELIPMDIGDEIDLLGQSFTMMDACGHADGQCIFWNKQQQHLFLADVLAANSYLYFVDWPNTYLDNPLLDFFKLANTLRELGPVKAFPGHGPTFDDLNVRLNRLCRRHEHCLDIIEKMVTEPLTAGDIYWQLGNLYGQPVGLINYVHMHRIIIGETLAYLKYLVKQDRLKSWEDEGVLIFAPGN